VQFKTIIAANLKSAEDNPNFTHGVFLDEINTNSNLCGILKDIQIDG